MLGGASRSVVKGERGDTIVEVLISIAIVSLVLAVAYAITNANLKQVQDANERSQALQLAQKQIELLRVYTAKTPGGTLSSQCLDESATPQSASASPTPNDCNFSPTASANCSTSFCYNTSDQGPISPNGQYEITVTWANEHGSSSTVILDYKPAS